MNTLIRQTVAGALLSLGLVGASSALTLATGPNAGGTTTFSFNMLSNAPASFTVYVTSAGGPLVAPTSLALFKDSAPLTPLAPAVPVFGTGGALVAIYSNLLVSAGLYNLVFDAPAVGGSFTVLGSSNLGPTVLAPVSATQVPEAGALAMAFAGLGVLGWLGRRRSA